VKILIYSAHIATEPTGICKYSVEMAGWLTQQWQGKMFGVRLLPQSPKVADLVLPSKLSDLLASGSSVIATCRNSTEISRVESKCGLVVTAEDGTAFASAIIKLADDDEARQTLRVQGRHYAEDDFEKMVCCND
jgi:colanic acid biosynthesis glycosyl transferase WcaI